MINRLCLVLAHGGARETVNRHLPMWKRFHDKVMIASPHDDPLIVPGTPCLIEGQSGRYDAKTNLRTRNLFELAGKMEVHLITFCEYDAMLWRYPVAETMRLRGNCLLASKFDNDDPKFKGAFYLHSPIIMTPYAAKRIAQVMDILPPDAEFGFGDRYIGLAAEKAGTRIFDGHALGLSYSQNHIERQHWDEATKAVRNGACLSHGIKDAETFAQMLEATWK